MNTAHDLMEQLRGEGAARFAATALAKDPAPFVRRVRRDRAVRTSLLSIAGVAVAGAAAVGATHLGAEPVAPAVTASTPPDGWTQRHSFTIAVYKQETIDAVVDELAQALGVENEDALNAIVRALPPEANGDPEGWVAAGEHTFVDDPDEWHGLQNAANGLVAVQVEQLESLGVPRDEWRGAIVLASIIQWEAPAGPSDQGVVARVIRNRLAADMPLQLDSVPSTYETLGLPSIAIGAFTPEALEAAVNPASGDWLYFLRKDDGNVLPYATYEDFAAAVEEQNSTP